MTTSFDSAHRRDAAAPPSHAEGWETVAGAYFAASPAALGVVDAATGAILDANPALCAFLGRSREDLTALALRDVTPPEDGVAPVDRLPESPAPLRHEQRYLRPDGTVVWGTVTVTPLPGAADGRARNVVQIEEIARRRRDGGVGGTLPLAKQWLLEQVPAAVFIHPLDPDVPPTYVSPRIEAITGYRMEELLTQRDFLLPHIHEEDAPAIIALSAETDRTLAPFVVDYRFQRKDGCWIWLHNVTEVVRDDAGAPLYWQGFVEDVTALKEAEADLAASEARFRSTFEDAAIGMAISGTDGTLLAVNRAFCEMLGHSKEEMVGRPIQEFTHPEDRDVEGARLEPVMSGGRGRLQFEKRYLRKDGTTLWGSLNVSAIRDDAGRVLQVVAQVEDITARKAAEAALAEREAQLRSSFEDAAIGMALVAPDGRFLDANPTLCRSFGYPREELMRRTFQELTHPDDLAADLAEYRRALAGEIDHYRIDKRYLRADGGVFWGRLSVSCVRDASGRVLRFVSQIEDVTARTEAEEALRDAEARYRGLIEQVPAVVYTLPLDPELPPIFVSPKIEALTGRTPAEVSRDRTFLRQFVHPDDIAANLPLMVESDLTLQPCVMRYRIRHTDGRWIWLLDSSEVVRDERGEPLCWQGVLVDITAEKALQDALAASEALFRSTFEDSAIGMAVVGPDAGILETNRVFREMLGYSPDELGGMSYHDLSTPEFEEANAAAFARLAAGETNAFRLEKEYLRRDGTTFWGSLNVSAVRDADGRLLRAVSQIEDVTVERRLRDALAESEALFRASFEHAAIGMRLSNAEGRLTDANPALCTLLGYSRDELVTMNFAQFTHPDDVERELVAHRRMVAGEIDGYRLEKRYVRKDGGVVWINLNASCVRGPDGETTLVIGQVEDITAVKTAQDALARSEEIFRTTVHQSRIATGVADAAGRFIDVNDALAEMTGYGRDELLAMAFADLGHPEDNPAEEAMFRETLAGARDHWVLEKRLVRKDGSILWAWVNVSAVRGPGGGLERLIGQVVDVTAVHEAQRALADALDMQRAANEELIRLSRQRAEFLAMLAHDFRTPLTAIQGYGDLLLLDADDPASVREYAQTISASAERLNRLVTDMLAVETLEARLGQLRLAPADVAALVTEAVHALHGAWPGRDIEIDAEPDLPAATVDRDQVTQAVTNLVGNALKYSPGGEPVAVSVRQDGPAIEIAVTDRGIGIPANKLDRVFDKYARIRSKETRGIQGVGLGLPIVRAVARAHGGDAWAESVPGVGSTFRLRLPLVPPAGNGTDA